MKISNKTFPVALALLMVGSFQPMSAHADASPKLTIRSERAAHPQIVQAINKIQGAVNELQKAPHDFGGNKLQAINDSKAAIHSLKKALYYRLKMDDAAIDRAQ